MQNVAQPFPTPRPRDPAREFHGPRVGRADVLLARAVLAYLRRVARSTRIRWVDECGDVVRSTDVDSRFTILARRRQPVVLTYYIADALGVAALALADPEFLALMRTLRCIVDDTVAGRVSGAIIEQLGGRYALLPLPGDPNRVRGVYDVIRAGEPCAFPVDGGGPYRQVGTGVIGLAASLSAIIVPLAVHLTRSVSFAPQSKVRVPVPGARLIASMAEPVRIVRGGDRQAAALTVKGALDRISLAVDRVL
jgi:hypothetical protein